MKTKCINDDKLLQQVEEACRDDKYILVCHWIATCKWAWRLCDDLKKTIDIIYIRYLALHADFSMR